MATIVRGTKSVGGGTNFVSGTILSSEVDTDFNTIVNDYNGNITNVNIAAGAAIDPVKVNGYSDTAAHMADEVNPGVTGATSAAVSMRGELQRIRYRLKELGLGTATTRLDGTAGVDLINWFDTPVVGPNLIRNGNFAVKTTAVNSAPDGWDLVSSPTCDLTTTGVTEGHSTARAIRIASAGATLEGISQTIKGLKASTKYLVGCRAKVNVAGDIFRLLTTGAAAGSFDDLALDEDGLTYQTVVGVIETDATPTDIVVKLLTVADGDSADITHCWFRECALDKIPTSNSPWAYQEITTNTPDFYTPANTFKDSGLTVNVVPPGPGYVVEVACKMTTAGSGSAVNGVFVLKENGTEVDSDYVYLDSNSARERGTCKFNYVKRDPTPGTTYTYTVEGAGIADTIDLNCVASAAAETPKSWIRCRCVLESGGF